MGTAAAGVSGPAGAAVDSAGPGRYAAELCGPAGRDHPGERPIVLGGSSFGGMVACEMAGHLQPKALVLVGSCRRPEAIRRDVRWLRPILSHVPAWGVAAAKPLAPLVLFTFGSLTPEQKRLCAAMFRASDRRWLRWAIGAILHWRPTPIAGLRVFQIHGRRDRMIRAFAGGRRRDVARRRSSHQPFARRAGE